MHAVRDEYAQHTTLDDRQPVTALTKNDTGGEFPKQADSDTASLMTMADVGFKSPVPRRFGRPRYFTIATSMRSGTSPPVSRMKESQLWVHIASLSLRIGGPSDRRPPHAGRTAQLALGMHDAVAAQR